MSKTIVDLNEVGYFFYASDLAIEPIIKAKHNGTFFELKTTKDENVDFVNGEITVITTEVTALKTHHKETENVYDASSLKNEIDQIATLAKANKASLNGQVVMRQAGDDEDMGVYRILVVDNKVTVEEGALAARWPDGTTSTLPKGSN